MEIIEENSEIKKNNQNHEMQKFDIEEKNQEEKFTFGENGPFRDKIDYKKFLKEREFLEQNFESLLKLSKKLDENLKNGDFDKKKAKEHFINELRDFFDHHEKDENKEEKDSKKIQRRNENDEFRKMVICEIQNMIQKDYNINHLFYGKKNKSVKEFGLVNYYKNKPILVKEPFKRAELLKLSKIQKDALIELYFSHKNKSSIKYLKLLFANFTEIRTKIIERMDEFVQSKILSRPIEIMRVIFNLLKKFEISNKNDVTKEKLEEIENYIIINKNFKFPWSDSYYKKALEHFKQKTAEALLEMIRDKKCDDSNKNGNERKEYYDIIDLFQVKIRILKKFEELKRKLGNIKIDEGIKNFLSGISYSEDIRIPEKYFELNNFNQIFDKTNEEFEEICQNSEKKISEIKKKVSKKESIETEELINLDEILHKFEKVEYYLDRIYFTLLKKVKIVKPEEHEENKLLGIAKKSDMIDENEQGKC